MARQSIGQFLATLRHAHGYTQQEVADKLNVSNRAVSTWERDSSMPDVLLLPIIAELYGVTVDEILNGARMERNGELPTLSQKAESALLKKKYSRFTTQVFILLGIYLFGILALFFGWYTFESTYSPLMSYRPKLSERWEIIPIVVGAVTVIASMTAFVAIWAHSETSVGDTLEKKREYTILLRRLAVVWLNVAGVLAIIFSSVAFALIDTSRFGSGDYLMPLVLTFLALGVVLLFFGVAVNFVTLYKFGDDTMHQQVKSNRKLSLKISLWGLIPLCVAIVLVVIFTYVQPTKFEIYYQNDNHEEFREHMETLRINEFDSAVRDGLRSGEYRFNLSELAQNYDTGIEIDVGDGFSVMFLKGPYDCVVMYDTGKIKLQFSCMRIRYGKYSVYDLYYRKASPAKQTPFDRIYGSIHSETVVKQVNGNIIFGRETTYDLLPLFDMIGFAIVAIDAAVCIAIYYCKRERTEIKL